jgi:exodeoxyribonuclease V alpha subunit
MTQTSRPSNNKPQASMGATALPWTALDLAWLDFLKSHQASSDPLHDTLALLVSHQMGQGHACLDLEALWQAPSQLLGWTDLQIKSLVSLTEQSANDEAPADLFFQAHNPWALAAKTLPWAMGDHSPIVLALQDDGQALRVYLRRAWSAEQTIHSAIQHRLAQHFEVPHDVEAKLSTLFGPTDTSNNVPDWQRIACAKALRSGLTLITGGPGTGKTTTVVRLLALLQRAVHDSQKPLRIHLAAPTGKAASRLSSSIQSALNSLPPSWAEGIPTQAVTLHQLLQYNPDAAARPAPLLATDLVVVDEASMIDLELMARLMKCVPQSARLVLLGDKDQLASVEAGAVWSQLCEGASQSDDKTQAQTHQPYTLQAQTAVLHVSRRFHADSAIGEWSRCINVGQLQQLKASWQSLPQEVSSNSQSQLTPKPEVQRWPDEWQTRPQGQLHQHVLASLRTSWREWLSDLKPLQQSGAVCDTEKALNLLNNFGKFQVLCALRQGPWGVETLNELIGVALGLTKSLDRNFQATKPQEAWYVGRPVMITRNDYHLHLMNGDVGQCLPTSTGLRVAFPDGKGGVRWILPSRLDAVETVFAMTVHKSQGSEYAHVLMVLPDREAPVLTRELLYTGITRAKSHLTWWVPKASVLWAALNQRVTRSGGLAEALFHRSK